ncbi:TetR/AcrR family transcriptional regulator [Streptomyces sp. NPDC048442]|uniref:TetR/AcrR family transcriptional regulator n=1 Tax=Streptomyces sp. NPDC048442 TaxID=3154823 RepID=UPI003422ECB3
MSTPQTPALRERLIDAGAELVARGGTASLGLREIARRAGVSHGAPRRYFPTHHALLSAIAQRGFEELGARFDGAVASAASPRAQLGALGRAYVGYALEHRGMFELMFRHDLLDSEVHGVRGAVADGADGAAEQQPRLRESTLPLMATVVDLVTECRTHEEGRPDPAVTAAALWANLHGIAQLWTWGSLQLALDDATLTRCDELVAASLDAHLGPAGTA